MAPNPSPNIKAAPVLTAIDGILDLHAFRPKEVPDLIREYLRSCRAAHVTEIRIIHGKGKGILHETVHTLLRREPMVRNFRLANDRSGWGATLVDIYPPGVPLPPRSAPASKAQMLESAPGWYRLLQRIFVKR
ncbi:Smr/MutS family protein [Acidithiobacillus ferriphilus]|uniref:Smr/MutS family protein n=1 Tax=Acidithiobacillus ferriphilus TaxID=1689834 RepID=UPI001C06A134|nr:Smr/MutS family protein [Acidithiobacillus ferriphilus]MBU2847712.1 Smr/MutS family protein [Acidithiobacillus ferriphilus]